VWVHFNFVCDMNKQKTLHKMLRSKINDLKKLKVIDGAVLTYHDDTYPPSLYLCLDIPSLGIPELRCKLLLMDRIRIPDEVERVVKEGVESLDKRLSERLELFDYEVELMCNNAPFVYGFSIGDIIRIASIGTQIALEILEDEKTKNKKWENDNEIRDRILSLINSQLKIREEQALGLHFVCNPLGVGQEEAFLRNWGNIELGSRFLQVLYSWNETK
jgi:hypothetical protein